MSMKLEEFARESRATHKGDKSGVPIVGLEHLIPQEIKFSGYDVDTENTFTKTFKKGQILFGRRRAYLKKAAIADLSACSTIEPNRVCSSIDGILIQRLRRSTFVVLGRVVPLFSTLKSIVLQCQ